MALGTSNSPANGALVAGVTRLVALRGGAGQRGVPVHAEGVVLAALLAPTAGSAAEQISAGEAGWESRFAFHSENIIKNSLVNVCRRVCSWCLCTYTEEKY